MNDKLKKEFEEKFCIYDGTDFKNCPMNPQIIWQWIEENFVPKDQWIPVTERLPEWVKDKSGVTKDYSENVFAKDDKGNLYIMCLGFERDGDDNGSIVWCNCYGSIDGDGEYDDDYNITHWMPLPKP